MAGCVAACLLATTAAYAAEDVEKSKRNSVFVSHERGRDTDLEAHSIGLWVDTRSRYVNLSPAIFASGGDGEAALGLEVSAGLSLPYFLTPYAGAGVLGAFTIGTYGGLGLGVESFVQWGGMLRVRRVWAFYGRRDYADNFTIARGDRNDYAAFGLSFPF